MISPRLLGAVVFFRSVSVSSFSRTLLVGGACLILLGARPAEAHFVGGTADWIDHKRQLCYQLLKQGDVKDPDIGDEISWRAWIKHAIDVWNDQTASRHGSLQTGWQFRRCAPGKTPDVIFRFDRGGATTNGKGGATTTDFHQSQIRQLTVWVRPDVTDQFVLNKKKEGKKPSGGSKGTGWGRNGATTLDPVLVIVHELTHVMRLDHDESTPVDTGSFEESIGIGNHAEPRLSRSDIIEVQRSDIDRRETSGIATVTSKGNISLVTGFTNTGRNRDFIGHDALAVPPDDAVGLPGHSIGIMGLMFSSYWPIVFMPNGTQVQLLLRTGVSAGLGDTSDRVTGVSVIPRFDGTVANAIIAQVPLLAGVSIPLNDLGQAPGGLTLEAFAGAQVTQRRAGFSGRELGAITGGPIDVSETWTSFDPAVGVGLQYGVGVIADRLVSVGASVLVNRTGAHTVTGRSPNFGSKTYFSVIPAQTEVCVLFNATMSIGVWRK
jgi:hypothetical protein